LYALNDRWLRIAGITSLMILTIVSNGFLQQSLIGLALVRLLLFKFEHFISGNSNFSGNKLTGVSANSRVNSLECVGELRKVESRANFVATKQQSDDQKVLKTDRPSMGRNFAFLRS
jgi:hypothetical protein